MCDADLRRPRTRRCMHVLGASGEPHRHPPKAKVSSPLIGVKEHYFGRIIRGDRMVMSIIVGRTMHYFVSEVLMLFVRNSKKRYVEGRRKIN